MNEKLNIQDLIDSLAEKHGMSKKNAESFVKEFFQLIEEALENDKNVKVKGLGTFKLTEVERRESVNVNTGERCEIQEHTKVSFTPDPVLKEAVNKPFSHFETVVLNESTVLDDTMVVEEDGKETDETSENNDAGELRTALLQPVTTGADVATCTADAGNPPVEASSGNEVVVPEEGKEAVEPPVKQLSKEERSTMKYFISIVAFVVILCIGAVFFMYYPDWLGERDEIIDLTGAVKQDVKESGAEDEEEERNGEEKQDKDSMAQAVADTVAIVRIPRNVADAEKERQPSMADKRQPATVEGQSVEGQSSSGYEIAGTKSTHTVAQGETLTRISLKYYGTKDLWPYIVRHNPKIKNPDNVPYGTVLKIPELVRK